MTITILHLYYDILNLYGESGNIKAIKSYLERLGIKVVIKFATLDDLINLKNIDLIYIGMGTEKNEELALKHLIKYKKNIKEYILNDGFVLSTGNSIELFGESIKDNKKIIKALNIFDYKAVREEFRIVDELLFKCKLTNKYVIGFTNRNSLIKTDDNYLFEVEKGIGNYPKSKFEGYHYKNFYGTYLIGPLLVRNPNFLRYFAKELIYKKDRNFKIKNINLYLENRAYNEFMKNYYASYLEEIK